jgi:LPS-assembly lipoprotein
MHLISESPNSELTRVLSNATFAASGVTWVERGEATYILRLGPERFSQRNLSVNAQARAAEFDLQMRAVRGQLDADGKVR